MQQLFLGHLVPSVMAQAKISQISQRMFMWVLWRSPLYTHSHWILPPVENAVVGWLLVTFASASVWSSPCTDPSLGDFSDPRWASCTGSHSSWLKSGSLPMRWGFWSDDITWICFASSEYISLTVPVFSYPAIRRSCRHSLDLKYFKLWVSSNFLCSTNPRGQCTKISE